MVWERGRVGRWDTDSGTRNSFDDGEEEDQVKTGVDPRVEGRDTRGPRRGLYGTRRHE